MVGQLIKKSEKSVIIEFDIKCELVTFFIWDV